MQHKIAEWRKCAIFEQQLHVSCWTLCCWRLQNVALSVAGGCNMLLSPVAGGCKCCTLLLLEVATCWTFCCWRFMLHSLLLEAAHVALSFCWRLHMLHSPVAGGWNMLHSPVTGGCNMLMEAAICCTLLLLEAATCCTLLLLEVATCCTLLLLEAATCCSGLFIHSRAIAWPRAGRCAVPSRCLSLDLPLHCAVYTATHYTQIFSYFVLILIWYYSLHSYNNNYLSLMHM